jgi:hypothetical protein
MTHPGGRPREHDRDKIASELLDWAKKEDSINLNKFCCTREPPLAPSVVLRWSKECDKFRLAYETAKSYLGFRREEWLSAETLHVKAYDLNATNYDMFMRDDKRQQAEYEASLKKIENNIPTKVTFEVNYGTGNQIEILPKTLPASDTPSP